MAAQVPLDNPAQHGGCLHRGGGKEDLEWVRSKGKGFMGINHIFGAAEILM